MNRLFLYALVVCLVFVAAPIGVTAQTAAPTASLKGVVTDPSGATVPDAMVQLRGPGGEYRARTQATGQYTVGPVRPGKYSVRVLAKGFTLFQVQDVDISSAANLDVQLSITAEAQVVNVEAEANSVSTDPTQNGGALVLGEKELATLSDDPDELEQQLQAMAGPSAGPSGGQIYIDGFTGGNLPPKASIREVRINSNPFSSEYDRPGFGRIEILTKPGTDNIRGQAFFQYNNENLNSRSPLLASATRPPYDQKFFGFHLTGPIKKQKASFGFDVERRSTNENALILATNLDSNFNPITVNQAVVTPQTRMTISPRLDLSLNSKNTLVVRYMNARNESDNVGVGNFSLASQAYNRSSTEHSIQATETAVLSARAINETRFQYMRMNSADFADNSKPAISVQGAFVDGGPQVGNSGVLSNHWEVTNISTFTKGTHTWKWGARLRRVSLDDTSVSNFGGTYAFFGGMGPELDANNQPIPGTAIQLSALERYRRTLLFQSMKYDPAQIAALGGGASQFSRSAGTATTSVSQFDAGLFLNDDWRIKPNFTLSYGVRYELQTNVSDWANWAPRVGIAWGVDGKNGRAAKTVVRAGFGTFYDRISENLALSTLRYNGLTQQSYLIRNPTFFPLIPTIDTLAASQQPQQYQYLYSGIEAPRVYQWSMGVDRQINRYFRMSANYIGSRSTHVLRSLNINTPIDGLYPYGDKQIRMLNESNGFSRTNMLIISPNLSYKKLFLFGYYGFSHGMSDAEGQPADPYNLRAEWGPSSFGDIRHRVMVGTSVPLPWKLSISPFMMVSSGAPYNITTGRDVLGTGFTTQRPALLNLAASQCTGADLLYEQSYGCFSLNPGSGTSIERNFGQYRRGVEITLVADTFAAAVQLRAARYGVLDQAIHRLGTAGVGHRAHLRVGIQPVADLHRFRALDKPIAERIENALFDNEPRRADADLPGVAELVRDHGVERLLEIGVAKHQHRAVPAQFHRGALHVLGREAGEMLADRGRSGERQLAHDRRAEQMAADFVRHAEHCLRHFHRQAGVIQALQHGERAGRCFLGAFQDHAAPRRDRRAQLAARVADRKVPRRKGRDHADRLVHNGAARARGANQRAAIKPVAFARIEIEQADIHQHFDPGFAQRLALFQRRDTGDFLLPLQHQPCCALQYLRALLGGSFAPQRKAARRHFERPVQIGRVCQRQFAQRFTGGGIDHGMRAAAATGHALSADQHVQGGVGGHAFTSFAVRGEEELSLSKARLEPPLRKGPSRRLLSLRLRPLLRTSGVGAIYPSPPPWHSRDRYRPASGWPPFPRP